MSSSSESSATFKEAHVLVYAQFSSSHFKPILDLTYRLLTRGLRVTMAVTTNNLHLLQPLLSVYPSSLQALPLIFEENTDPSRNWLFANARTTYDLHSPVLLQFFQTHPSPPVAIISDFFLGWTHELASELGVPRLVFSPSPACALSVYYSLWRDLPKKEDPNDAVSFPNVPNSPSFPFRQLPPYYLAYKEGDADSEFYRNCELGNLASWGVVFNSFTELEGVYIDRIKQEHGGECDRVWAVGPLHHATESVTSVESGGSKHELLTWLDQRPNGSVIFVSFGSWVTLLDEQVKELADALELSGVHFIWRVNGVRVGHVGDECEVMPEGFQGRVGGRGFVIKGWVPQGEILRHQAVGAFLTHCGWSSVMEAVTAGVMMLTWPVSADQFINAKLLVEELGVAVRLCEGTQVIPQPDEMARILVEALDTSRPEKARVKRLSDAALEAVENGSSKKDLDELVKHLNDLKK